MCFLELRRKWKLCNNDVKLTAKKKYKTSASTLHIEKGIREIKKTLILLYGCSFEDAGSEWRKNSATPDKVPVHQAYMLWILINWSEPILKSSTAKSEVK